MENIVEIDDLRIEFHLRDGVVNAVNGVSMAVKPGEVLGVVGESGSGKSLSARAVMNLLPRAAKVTHGTVRVRRKDGSVLSVLEQGRESQAMREIRGGQVGMIFQEPMTALSPMHSIGQQVMTTLSLHTDLSKAGQRDRAQELLDLVLLPNPREMLDKYPHQLSGGMRQRAMIAMALSCNPALLLADEPTTALDVTTEAQILELIRDLQERFEMGVIFITHNFGVVAELADRLTAMKSGEVVEQGGLERVFYEPQHPYTQRLLSLIPRLPDPSNITLKPEKPLSKEPVIEVRDLSMEFPTKSNWLGKPIETLRAVDGVSFQIDRGETFGVVGESGSGKSTVARCIMGAYQPTAGSIQFRDRDNTTHDLINTRGEALRTLRNHFQMVFQEPYSSLNPRMTVEQLIGEPLINHGETNSKLIRDRAAELLEKVGLSTAMLSRYPHADFFLLPLLRIWRDYQDALPDDLSIRLRNAITGFRYWTDEPGNDVMWFWSENHVLCFHVAQYVAGSFTSSTFSCSNRTGAEQRDIAALRLERWFTSVEVHGFAEWNSAAYYPIDLIGLLTLHDMGKCADLKGRAARMCDLIFAMTALHTINCVSAGSQGRAYEKELFAGPATELAATAAVAFGGPYVPGFERSAALFALSDYAPPDPLLPLSRARSKTPIEARYVQGLDANAKINLWRSDAVLLSSIADHKTGAKGHQQHVVDVVFSSDPFARVWINHPGDLKPWGGSRPSYWAGSGVVPRVAQDGNVACLIFDLERQQHPIDFTHVLLPQETLDDITRVEDWVFVRAGEGYCAVWCSQPLHRHETGLYAGSEWRAYGQKSAWVVSVGSRSQHGSFDAFQSATIGLAPQFDSSALKLTSRRNSLAFDGAFSRDGQPLVFGPMSIWPHLIENEKPHNILGYASENTDDS